MTVWAKLQSWIGAAASGTDLDNEFNNIYTGLNESQNGSRPSGYNDVRLTYSTDQLTVKGETKVNGVNVDLNSTITVSGATGWRYVVTTTGGVVSVETIPGGEITANTIVYSPTPVFNNTLNGYYSTVNTTRRIIGVIWYDATTKILEAIAYGNGAKKNDDYWYSNNLGVNATAVNDRLQYTAAFDRARGDSITCADNGAGTNDSFGFRITANKAGFLNINISFYSTYNASTASAIQVAIRKNNADFNNFVLWHASNGGASSNEVNQDNFSVRLPVQKNDYFVFNAYNITGTAGVAIYYPVITFEEI